MSVEYPKLACFVCHETFKMEGSCFCNFVVEMPDEKKLSIQVYACPKCGALRTENHGPVTVNSGEEIARKGQIQKQIEAGGSPKGSLFPAISWSTKGEG